MGDTFSDTNDLIYDVGMHFGDDTAFYLSQAFRVIGIEGNPEIAAKARDRFSKEIQSGQLTIVNAGIAETSGTAPFWVCEENSTWNSFHEKIAARNGMKHHSINIPTRRFREILDQYGVPLYLKIDIEGNDPLCISDLAGRPLPRFVSMESECTGDSEDLTEAEFLSSLHLLHDTGYRRFKLIRQDHIAAEPYSDFARFMQRLIYATAYGRLRLRGLSSIAKLMTSEERLNRVYRYPTAGGIKPWGGQMPGPWLTFAEAKALYLKARNRHFRRIDAPKFSFWYDWHATV